MTDYFAFMLKTGICLAAMTMLYTIFLRKETFFQMNRCFLLVSLIGSMLIPFSQFSFPGMTEFLKRFPWLLPEASHPVSAGMEVAQTSGVASHHFAALNWQGVLTCIYLAGVLFFGIRFLLYLVRIRILIRTSQVVRARDYRIVWIRRPISPFSFFNIVFMNRDHLAKKDFQKIIAHERIHMRQWHTVDLFLAEMILVLQWMNPFVWPYKRFLKETHEYLADAGVIAQGCDAASYQLLIVEQIVGTRLFGFSSSFHHTQIKRRIQMMLQNPSRKRNRMKLFLFVPVVMFLTILFTSLGQVRGAYAAPVPPEPAMTLADGGDDSTKVSTKDKEKKEEFKKQKKEEEQSKKKEFAEQEKKKEKEAEQDPEMTLAKLKAHMKELQVKMEKTEVVLKELAEKREAMAAAGENLEMVEAKMQENKLRMKELHEKAGVIKKEIAIVKERMAEAE
ncbi:hypothetical protein JW948_01090 [bacterium]|nr:hypothetical protein [bacterium]